MAFFSAGDAHPSPAQLSDVAVSARATRATIHVFTIPRPRDDSALNLQVAPLEALAKSAGGALVSLGGNPERTISRTAAEQAACDTFALEPAATDTDGMRHALRAEVTGRDLIVRGQPAPSTRSPDRHDTMKRAPGPRILVSCEETMTQREPCPHLRAITDVKRPKHQACESCVATGGTWVHLRTCQQCGMTLCCDSSPNRHASKHAKTTGHPVIIASAEPGERWLYCYPDDHVVDY
jgi:hypothetical protein